MRSKVKKVWLSLLVAAGLVVGVSGGAEAIVNGTESAPAARPYQVSLQADGEHYCGGTIVDATTIITAAHCVEGETAAGTTIRAGVTDVTSTNGQDVGVASITSHPSYAQNELADIAVIKLTKPLTLGENVQAIPLATAGQVEAATTGIVSGWGAVSENGGDSNVLLEAAVPLVSDEACSVALGTDADTEVCAGGTGTDSCYGDSGGPLAIDTGNGLALAGVVSWGEECGGTTPGVYADVPGLTEWLDEVRGGSAADDADDNGSDPEQGNTDGDDEDDIADEDGADESDGEFDEFIDGLSDEEFQEFIDGLSDEEFDELFGDGADEDGADESDGEFDEFIDGLSDEEFQEFIDGLSDDEFDELFGDGADEDGADESDEEFDEDLYDDAEYWDDEYDDDLYDDAEYWDDEYDEDLYDDAEYWDDEYDEDLYDDAEYWDDEYDEDLYDEDF